jgi:hypothetical protein
VCITMGTAEAIAINTMITAKNFAISSCLCAGEFRPNRRIAAVGAAAIH